MSQAEQQLQQFGWDDWFAEQARELTPTEQRVARVVAVDREQFVVMDESGEYRARLSGRFLHTTGEATDFPCVGDWVALRHGSSDTIGIIQTVIPRRSFLRRKAAGNSIDYQMIAANIDAALIVQSCQFDFNINRLERYLVMVRDGHVMPVILLTKADLVSPATLEQQIGQIKNAGINAEVIALSNITGEGVDKVGALLCPGKTYCLLGSSGIGKSTLINRLIGRHLLATRVVSDNGEGRHTTVRRELIMLESGAMLIDTPGMREFGILGAEEGIGDSFADIYQLALACRYKDCSHANEPGCAVLNALEEGSLHPAQYQNFVKLRSESAFHEMSYLEKRNKDKAFGRQIKSIKKDLKRNF
ncbi:MAG: ribosome small subunit-dependent GTPase A [Geobacter sp.]|nr:ribosome small subunit-dependent GTPase A [Geobacter sp.]